MTKEYLFLGFDWLKVYINRNHYAMCGYGLLPSKWLIRTSCKLSITIHDVIQDVFRLKTYSSKFLRNLLLKLIKPQRYMYISIDIGLEILVCKVTFITQLISLNRYYFSTVTCRNNNNSPMHPYPRSRM